MKLDNEFGIYPWAILQETSRRTHPADRLSLILGTKKNKHNPNQQFLF